MTELSDWNDRYRDGNLPWDTGRPSSELQRVISQHAIQPCRALDLGCGTGTNCVWLAQQGFDVTGIDVAPLAIERAEERARAAGVNVQFVAADILNLPDPDRPFSFFLRSRLLSRRPPQRTGGVCPGHCAAVGPRRRGTDPGRQCE